MFSRMEISEFQKRLLKVNVQSSLLVSLKMVNVILLFFWHLEMVFESGHFCLSAVFIIVV